jgi:Zn-dependent peptidase ImmA (M78 family)
LKPPLKLSGGSLEVRNSDIMKWIKDRSGRFQERPFYEFEELDYICEDIISGFMLRQFGEIKYPIATNSLEILLESEASDVDFYADLSTEGPDVEGVTQFYRNQKPKILITNKLSNEARYENRYRTTLTHELGHVKLHSFLWTTNQLPLLPSTHDDVSPKCKRESILNAQEVDWMEWQAGYASGAYLIPITPLRSLAKEIVGVSRLKLLLPTSNDGQLLIKQVQHQFQVSAEAAEVRLRQLRYFPTQNRA